MTMFFAVLNLRRSRLFHGSLARKFAALIMSSLGTIFAITSSRRSGNCCSNFTVRAMFRSNWDLSTSSRLVKILFSTAIRHISPLMNCNLKGFQIIERSSYISSGHNCTSIHYRDLTGSTLTNLQTAIVLPPLHDKVQLCEATHRNYPSCRFHWMPQGPKRLFVLGFKQNAPVDPVASCTVVGVALFHSS